MSGAGNAWRTMSSRPIYSNPWFSVREDKVLRPDGSPGIYGVVEMPPYVGVVAIRHDGQVAMVWQWRYLTGRLSLEIPAGNSSPDDASLEETARRELGEEAGIAARSWMRLGHIDYSAVSNPGHLFLAMGLTDVERPSGIDDWTAPSWMPYRDVVARVIDGEIAEATSVVAILMAEANRNAGHWSLDSLDS